MNRHRSHADIAGILFVSKEQFEDQARQILRVTSDLRTQIAAKGVSLVADIKNAAA